ncbi:MAG: CvpA family protein [Pirellulales bacterium]
MNMEPYDICMLAVLALATIYGAYKGMVWQIASTASLVLSYAVALHFSPKFAHYFGTQAPLNRFVAMAALYIGTSAAIWLVFRVVKGVLDRVRLREFDRHMGAVFGAAKGILLCVAITFFAVTLSARLRGMVLESRSGHYIAVLLNRADTVMPQELHEVLDPYLQKLERELDPTHEHNDNEPPVSVPRPATIPAGNDEPEQGSDARRGNRGDIRRLPPVEVL